MRTRTKALAVLWLVAIGFASAALALQEAEIQSVSGSVVAVDARAGTFTVRPETAALEPTANVTLLVDDQTKIRKHGLKINLQDLRSGDAVTATFRMSFRDSIALAVMVE